MWSPLLVPQPKDWPEHVDIVGSFKENFIKEPIKATDEIIEFSTIANDNLIEPISPISDDLYVPSEQLNKFISTDVPIVFIGFGSMVIPDMEDLITLFLEAAAIVNVKVSI